MRAFVTGATGFIGRRLIKKLLKENYEVFALVRNNNHNLNNAVNIVKGDILAPESYKTTIKTCDNLYHLAALVTFDPQKRQDLIHVNGIGTETVLNEAMNSNIKNTVIVSSAATIGLSYSKTNFLNEEAPMQDNLLKSNPYMHSKIITEQKARDYSDKMNVVIVNPSTCYGPDDWSLNSGTLIKKIAKSKILPVPAGGGNVVDVDDVVDGIILAGQKGQSSRRYILSNENLTFKQIFSKIADCINHRPKFIQLPPMLRIPMSIAALIVGKITKSRFITPGLINDMFAYKYFDNSRAKEELGWHPQYSFEDSVKRAWKFYKENSLID